MSLMLAIVVLAVVWAVLSGGFTLLNLLLGGAIALLALLLFRDRFAAPQGMRRFWRGLELLGFLAWEMLASAVRVGLLVLSPGIRQSIRPGFIAFPLTVTGDGQITLLANLITLTPGTLSVDVSPDRRTLYIHALDARDREGLVRGIAQGFERRVIEVTR